MSELGKKLQQNRTDTASNLAQHLDRQLQYLFLNFDFLNLFNDLFHFRLLRKGKSMRMFLFGLKSPLFQSINRKGWRLASLG